MLCIIQQAKRWIFDFFDGMGPVMLIDFLVPKKNNPHDAKCVVYISHDELLPTAGKYGEHHVSIVGLIAGMMLMALSQFFFI